jgi:hypothetical protein
MSLKLLTVTHPKGQFQLAVPSDILANDRTVEYPRVVNPLVLLELENIVSQEPVVPGRMRSWSDVLALITIASEFMTNERLSVAFADFGKHPTVRKLTNPEDMFRCHIMLPESCDVYTWLRTSDNIDAVKEALVAYPADSTLRQYIARLDPVEIFAGAQDRATRKRVENLKAMLAQIGDELLVETPEHIAVTGPSGPYHDCSAFAQPVTTTYTITHAEVVRRFHEATYNVFQPKNGKHFPRALFSGGLYTKLLAPTFDKSQLRGQDIDIFALGKDFAERERAFKEILQWFDSPNTYYAVLRSVVSVYILDIPRKFQIISSNSSTAASVLMGFDLSHVQHGMLWGEVPKHVSTPAGLATLQTRVATLNPSVRTNAKRCFKALKQGYHVDASPSALEICDITTMVANPANEPAKSYQRELTTYYLPRSDPDMTQQELTEFVLACIQKDAQADSSTTNIDVVLQTTVIGSNFRGNYDMRSFTTFDATTVKPSRNNRRDFEVHMLDNRDKRIFMLSANMKVLSVHTDAETVTIKLATEPLFAEFLQTLQSDVYRLYRQGGVTRNIIVDNAITITLQRTYINACIRKGSSVLRNQYGRPLDIDEDLIEGATAAFVFTTQFVSHGDERFIRLHPLSVIKQTEGTPNRSDTDDDTNAVVAPEATFEY